MRKIAVLLLGVGIMASGPVYGQSSEGTDPSIKISNAVQAPASSVDLLKQSVQKNSPFATVGKAPKVPVVPPKKTNVNSPVEKKISEPAQPAAPALETKPSEPVASAAEPPAHVPPAAKEPATAPAGNGITPVPSPSVKGPGRPVPPPGPRMPRRPRRPRIQTAPVSQQRTVSQQPAETAEPAEDSEEEAADAETEYAVKLLEKSKQQALNGRALPPSAAKNKTSKVPSANKKFNPNAFRPGVTWVPSKSTHFDIYTQKSEGHIGSANMALTFETAYETLRRFIPWMMSGRVRVFVYQDHDSYLRYEPEAKAWTRAIAYPTRGEVVVYDEPGHAQELKETFAHELTHIFTQQFFDKHKTGRIMTPTWLDEGLAVLVEDHMFIGKEGGPWNNDYRTLRFVRDPKTMPASFGSSKMFGGFEPKPFVPVSQRMGPNGPRRGKPVQLEAFEDFMQEGSLDAAEGQGETQNWYLQAYLMVRFLLNPGGGLSPSNRMQFEQFTRLIAEGEAVRNPSTGFLVKDARGQQVYKPYDVEKALSRAYRYNTVSNFEDAFWKWLNK